MKTAFALALLPAATAFMAPLTKVTRGRSMQMNFGYEEGVRPVGGVQFFPDSQQFWDPLGLTGGSEETLAKYQGAEIKHGRVAMLACLDYFIHGAGIKLPGSLGDVSIDSIPTGLAALKGVPAAGWAQIFLFASALEVLAPQKDDKVPGNVQPDTPAFAVPGDVEIRTKEINNGRLAMISILGIWVGEAISGGQSPFETLAAKLGN